MPAVVDHVPWETLGILLGRDVIFIKKPLGDVCINAPLWAYTYIPWWYSCFGEIVAVLLLVTALYYDLTCNTYSFAH